MAFDSRKSFRHETCEIDRGNVRRRHRREDNDTFKNTNYETCPLSSSDDTSKKRKVIDENDVSTMSLTQNSTSATTKSNAVHVSIPISEPESYTHLV